MARCGTNQSGQACGKSEAGETCGKSEAGETCGKKAQVKHFVAKLKSGEVVILAADLGEAKKIVSHVQKGASVREFKEKKKET